jgi:hypothetical protein
MKGAHEISQSLTTQRLKKWNGQSERVKPVAKQLNTDGLTHAVAWREKMLATQELAWAKWSTLQSPREIAWALCKTKSQNALEQ